MTVSAGFIQGESADGRWELAMTGEPGLSALPTAIEPPATPPYPPQDTEL